MCTLSGRKTSFDFLGIEPIRVGIPPGPSIQPEPKHNQVRNLRKMGDYPNPNPRIWIDCFTLFLDECCNSADMGVEVGAANDVEGYPFEGNAGETQLTIYAQDCTKARPSCSR